MTAHQIHNAVSYILYGLWQVGNVSMVWVLRTTGLIPFSVSPKKELIAWYTTEVVTILTGLSVMVALVLGVIKLSEWVFKKKKK